MLRLIRFLLLEIYLFFFSLAGTRARNSLYLLSLRFALAIFQSIRSLNYLVRFVFFFSSFFFIRSLLPYTSSPLRGILPRYAINFSSFFLLANIPSLGPSNFPLSFPLFPFVRHFYLSVCLPISLSHKRGTFFPLKQTRRTEQSILLM